MCGRQNNESQRCPRLSPEHVNKLFHVAKGIKVVDKINVANQLTLSEENILDSSGGPNVIFISETSTWDSEPE